MKKTVEEYIEMVRKDRYVLALKDIPKKVKVEHPEICIEAVKLNGDSLKYVPKQVRIGHPEICIEAVKKDEYTLKYVPEQVKIGHPEICIEAVKENENVLEYVPEEVQIKHPEMCMEAVKENENVLKYVPEQVKVEHPEICMEAVKEDGYILEYVPKQVQIEHPEICMEAVKRNGNALEYIPEQVKIGHPEMCMEAVKRNGNALEYIPEQVKIGHPEMCMEAVKKDKYTLKYVPEDVLKYVPEQVKIGHPEICIEAVKQNENVLKNENLLKYVPEQVKIGHPEICIEAVKRNGDVLKYVPEKVQIEHPEICMEAVKKDVYTLNYVPEKVQIKHPEICMEAIKKDVYKLKYVPEQVKVEHPEICMEAVKLTGYILEYVPKQVQIEHPEMCMEAVKENGNVLKYVPEQLKIGHPEMCMEAVKRNGNALEYIPEQVKIGHPEICMEAVKEDGYALVYIPEQLKIGHPEIFIEGLKKDINMYKFISSDRDIEEVKKFMFEDASRLDKIKEKANFDVSENYDALQMDIFYHQMIKSIGLDEVEKLTEIPKFSKEQIKQYGLEYNEKLNELFGKVYTLKGNIGATIDIFRGINLDIYEEKGRNAKYEVFRNLNSILEDEASSNISIEQLLVQSIEKSGFEVDNNVIEKFNARKDLIVKRLTDERYGKVDETLKGLINSNLTSQQNPIKRIIEEKLKENIQKNEGAYNKEELLDAISQELERKNEQGQNFYSPHIINQKEGILNLTEQFVEESSVKRILSKSLVETIKEQKEHIGKGWIRKIQNIPVKLEKEQFKEISERIGNIDNNDVDVVMELREGKNAKDAYDILAKNRVDGVITYEQIEMMFSSMREPYSEEFKTYYKQHKDEILQNPEVYMKLSEIHNNFDNIISRPEVMNRYKSGKLSLNNIMQILSEQKYENVREGNERLANLSANAGLDKKYFESAQKVYEITKKREGSTIPQVNVRKSKYRGRMLRADDPLNLLVGNITNCCQVLGGVGEGSMMHASTEENGGIFIVEELDKEGNVVRPVAQSWTWRNNGRICYDNIEIRNKALEQLNENDEKEIMDVYIEAGKRAIEADEKTMSKLLKEGEITQAVYDEVVLKEVTCGTGYNDLKELTKRIEEGKLNKTEEIILPKENEKIYNGYSNNVAWIDSSNSQILLASMDENKREEIENRRKERREKNEKLKRDIEVPIEYKNAREVETYKGKEIFPSIIREIKQIEKTVYRKEQQIMEGCISAEDLANRYELDEEQMELTISKDRDWYFIGQENNKEYYIADLALVGGVNSQKNKKVESDVKMATLEMAEKVYSKMLEMAEKGKNVRYEATRDTSYINTKKMKERGLIEILDDREDKFENSDIDMNNVLVKVNEDKMQEELSQIKELLEKLRKKGITKSSLRKNKKAEDISI